MSTLGKYIVNEFLKEDDFQKKNLEVIKKFIKFTTGELGLENVRKVIISGDLDKVKRLKTFGTFEPENEKIWIYVNNRNLADVLRTLAHELVHLKQLKDNLLTDKSGETGSEIENEANSQAGILLRKFGENNPHIYESLREGIYGDYLFGGNNTGVKYSLYPEEMEKDTPQEKKLFDILLKYIKSEYNTYNKINLDNFSDVFLQLKKDYPDLVDPKLPSSSYIYRGTVINKNYINELIVKKGSIDYKYGKLILNEQYSSKRKIQSWSTNYFMAATFALSTLEMNPNKDIYYPVVMRAKVSDADLYFSKEFTKKLSKDLNEDEVFNMKNPIKVDMMIIKEDEFEDEFENIEKNYLHNKI